MEVVSKPEPEFARTEPSAKGKVLNRQNAIKWTVHDGCHGTSGHPVPRAAVVALSEESENAKVNFVS